MGCGASNDRDEAAPREKNTGPPKRQAHTRNYDNDTSARPQNDDKYRATNAAGGTTDHQDTETNQSMSNEGLSETTLLSQAVLVELRQKSSKEQGSSVMRWVDTISTPMDGDNPEVYDPLKRHMLAMDSLRQRQGGAPKEA